MSDFLMGLLKVIGAFVVAISVALFSGLVLSTLWGWFMVKALGVPPLTIPAAMGISIVASYLTAHLPTKQDTREDVPFWHQMLAQALHAGLILALGALVHLFV